MTLKRAVRDSTTYPDLAGKRRLRYYVIASLWIFAVLCVIGLYGVYRFWQRENPPAVVEAPITLPPDFTPMNKLGPTDTPVPTGTFTPTSVPPTLSPGTPLPTATEIPTETPIPCPTDPEQWDLVDMREGITDNFKKIVQTCVYDGLARTVAWALAIEEGYSRAEAADVLGFDDLPMVWGTRVIKGMSNTKGPMETEVHYTPYHLDFTTWALNPNLKPSITYTLRGCYRTRTIVGATVETWSEYPVICELTQDYDNAIWAVSKLGEHMFTAGAQTTSAAKVTRYFTMFGYVGNGNWAWLGILDKPVVSSDQLAGIDLHQDRQMYADIHQVSVWDAEWLETTYALTVQPLPEGWQAATDSANMQAILDAMNKSP